MTSISVSCLFFISRTFFLELINLLFQAIVCNGLFALQAGIYSQLAQVCMYHLSSIHNLSNCSLRRLFLFPIKIAEHLIYLHYGKCDLMGVFQSNLILCRSQCSQMALLSLPSPTSSLICKLNSVNLNSLTP